MQSYVVKAVFTDGDIQIYRPCSRPRRTLFGGYWKFRCGPGDNRKTICITSRNLFLLLFTPENEDQE